MNDHALTVLALGVALLGCEAKTSVAKRSAPSEQLSHATPHNVRWFGALRTIMHEGRSEAAVRLADVLPGPHAWGLGALEGLRGEATVMDDVVWLARARPDGTAETTRADLDGPDADLGAALFVVANVAAWDQSVLRNEVKWSDLDAILAAELEPRGLDAPVPVRIDGPVAMLEWHVLDGSKPAINHSEHTRSAVRGVIELADARLIGFFSNAHQGVFTHAGARSHFHALIEDQHVSGHVDGMVLKPGARLFIAR
jgi:acetolactate decarboxylase